MTGKKQNPSPNISPSNSEESGASRETDVNSDKSQRIN